MGFLDDVWRCFPRTTHHHDVRLHRHGAYRVNGRADLDDLESMLFIDLPTGDWHTVGGLIFNSLGHVPSIGETIELNHHKFFVERVQGRRIARVLITPNLEKKYRVQK